MIEVFAGTGLSLISSALLWVKSQKHTSEWEDRGINIRFQWKSVFLVATLLAVLASTTAGLLGAGFLPAAALGILGWMTVLVTVTDFTTYKIPRETSILAYYLGMPLMVAFAITSGSWAPIVAFLVWFIIPTVLFFAAGKGLGMGDIRLLILFGTTVSWWVGIEYMFYALVAACLLQLLIALPVALITGRGRRAVPGTTSSTPEPPRAAATSADEEDLTVEVEAAEETLDATTDSAPKKDKGQKKKLHLPFGPALMVAFLGMGIYSASRIIDTCDILIAYFC